MSKKTTLETNDEARKILAGLSPQQKEFLAVTLKVLIAIVEAEKSGFDAEQLVLTMLELTKA